MNPFEHLTTEEQRALIARSSSGEHPVFAGEEAGGPITSDRHQVHAGRYFEVEPEQLLEVAKHIAASGEAAEKTVQRAYALICEAHLVSRNIRHWNEKARRGHVSDAIHSLVEEHLLRKGNDAGKVVRADLLGAFVKQRGGASNERDVRRIFNRWVTESLRLRSFLEEIPWNPSAPDFDGGLSKTLCEKGWIRWLHIGSSGFLILPEQTEKPLTSPRRKRKSGEHETAPWWGTKTVWWPAPSAKEIAEFKAEYLVDKQKHFRSAHAAKKALTKLKTWLDLQDEIESMNSKPERRGKSDPKTGKFQ